MGLKTGNCPIIRPGPPYRETTYTSPKKNMRQEGFIPSAGKEGPNEKSPLTKVLSAEGLKFKVGGSAEN